MKRLSLRKIFSCKPAQGEMKGFDEPRHRAQKHRCSSMTIKVYRSVNSGGNSSARSEAKTGQTIDRGLRHSFLLYLIGSLLDSG